jgi:hypothetical protein
MVGLCKMIDEALYKYLTTDLSITNLYYGSAENRTPPYTVMLKVNDPEVRVTLCDTQGEAGEALFQFSGYTGGEGAAADASSTVVYLETIKAQVKDVKGIIGTNPNDYRIWYNQTSGVRLINDGNNSLQRWGAIFETLIRWEKV